MTINLRRMGAIIAFIQFTNALEYMIFNPLFVYMAPTFQVPVSWAGYVSGIYTLASVISGIGAWRLVGKLNPRKFLLVNMALLGALTLMVLATQHFILLLILRFLAGLLGGMTMGVASSLLINAADQKTSRAIVGHGHLCLFAGQYYRHARHVVSLRTFRLADGAGIDWRSLPAGAHHDLCWSAEGFRRRWLWYKDTHHANDAVICQRQCVNPV